MPRLELTESIIKNLKTALPQEEFYDAAYTLGGSFGLRVSGKTGSKVFFLVYSIGGRRKRMTLGRYPLLGLAQARDKTAQTLELLAAGKDPAAEERNYKSASSFGDLAELFIERHVLKKCRPKTQREYIRIIEAELLPSWQHRKCVDITSEDIAALIDQISSARGREVLAKRVRSVSSRMFNFAVERGLLRKNPVRSTPVPTEEYPLETALSLSEAQLLWHGLSKLEPSTAGVFQLILLTAQKPSQVMSMRWSDISLDLWTPAQRLSAGQIPRQIPLSPQALAVLRTLHRRSDNSTFVFSRGEDSHISYIRGTARRLHKRIVQVRPWSPMDLRRTVLYRMPELGIRPDLVDFILGRNSAVFGKNSYYYSLEYLDEAKAALNLWGRTLAGKAPRERKPGKTGAKIIPLFK